MVGEFFRSYPAQEFSLFGFPCMVGIRLLKTRNYKDYIYWIEIPMSL